MTTRAFHTMPNRRGFTLIDLLFTVLLLLLLVSILLPILSRMRHSGGNFRCASNLRQIGQAIQMYVNDNRGQFPRTVDDGAGGPPTEYTGSAAANPFLPGGPGPNDVTACLFLLVRTQDITPEIFVCPSVEDARRRNFGGRAATAQQVSNFPGRRHLTYSYTNPYASPAVEKAGFKLRYSLTSDFAIAADMNPGGPAVTSVTPRSPRAAMAGANSRNHNGDGQNVLYADGHVEFQNTVFCGMPRPPKPPNVIRDNIYTHGAGYGNAPGVGTRGAPADPFDSVLLPTSLDGPGPSALETMSLDSLPVHWITRCGALGVVLLWIAHRRRRAKRPTPGPSPI